MVAERVRASMGVGVGRAGNFRLGCGQGQAALGLVNFGR